MMLTKQKIMMPRLLPATLGSVCVESYDGERQFFCIDLAGSRNAAHQLPSQPKPDEVLGYCSTIDTCTGKIFISYFAPVRASSSSAPDYKRGLFVLIGNELFPTAEQATTVKFSRGLSFREIEFLGAGKKVCLRYPWPIYKEAFWENFGDPFNFTSRDFCAELYKMINYYA